MVKVNLFYFGKRKKRRRWSLLSVRACVYLDHNWLSLRFSCYFCRGGCICLSYFFAERERQQQEAEQRRRTAIEVERKRQAELRRIGNCPAGYQWIHQGGGNYVCSAGGHGPANVSHIT